MATKIFGSNSVPAHANKSISVDFGGSYRPAFEQWGGNAFTAQWASGMSFGLNTSGYITAALRFKCEQFNEAAFCVLESKSSADGRTSEDKIEGHNFTKMMRYPCGRSSGAMTRAEFASRMIVSYELDGNAYALRLKHPRFGYTTGFQYLPHWRVSCVRLPGSTRGIDLYRYTSDKGVIDLQPDQVLHWKQGMSASNECEGWSPLRSVLMEVMTEREASVYSAYIMGNMGVGARVVTPKQLVTDDDWDPDFNEQVKSKFAKTKGEGRGDDIVIGVPLDVQELVMTPEKMVLDKVNLIPKEKILAVLNVDPAVVHLTIGYGESKGTDKKTVYENAWKAGLLPLGTSFCERLTIDVLPGYGNIDVQRVALDTSKTWALQEDLTKLHERTQKTFLANIATQNESREAVGLEKREGGDKTHNEFPQLINGNAGDSILNGTNGKLPNESDRSNPKGAVEVNE